MWRGRPSSSDVRGLRTAVVMPCCLVGVGIDGGGGGIFELGCAESVEYAGLNLAGYD